MINTSLAGCRVVGRLCVGNKYGLLLPELTYSTELETIIETIPDSVKIEKIDDKLSALGNVIVCNDTVALINPDLDRVCYTIFFLTPHFLFFTRRLKKSLQIL